MNSFDLVFQFFAHFCLIEAADNGIEHGSRFAKNLGFYDDVVWNGEDTEEVARFALCFFSIMPFICRLQIMAI